MLYHFLYPLNEYFIGFNVFKYITFRALMAAFTGMTIYFVFGSYFIKCLSKLHVWQTVREDGPVTHLDKRGIPTMGGLLLWIAVFVSILLWSRLDVWFIWAAVALIVGFGLIGFIDDYRKVVLKDSNGLKARWKFPLQLIVATIVVLVITDVIGIDRRLIVPFFKDINPNLGIFYPAFAVIVIVGTSNAVNLTDGLDGLVSIPSIVAFMAFAILAYIAGHMTISAYLGIPYVAGSGELAVLCGAIAGACVGFLWFNAHPADVFLGDVGALPLGAVLGFVALITKNEILLIIIGGIFVLETISVITQVISFKLTGKRVFRMAPLHHHFELKGWPESKVIVRFWIISFILALASLATLKLR